MDISMVHDSLAKSRAQCTVQVKTEKCINTYNGQNVPSASRHGYTLTIIRLKGLEIYS